MKSAAIVLAVIVVLGGGFWLVNKNDNSGSEPTPQSSQQQSSNAEEKDNKNLITYSDEGFSPSTLTVKAGTTVTVKNNSSIGLQFSSDDHPTHTKDPEINLDTIGPGQTTTFTPKTAGTHGFHNHLNSTDTGTLVVQ